MSLEGLSSLIQLESARLEGARQVTQSSQSVNQASQQSGLQTASSKQNIWLQQIDAKMQKEMAEADVRRIESKLQRERKAEKLSAMIANVVTVGSLASNLWDFGVNDLLKKDQKLGDTPSYLHTKPMDLSKQSDINLQWANKPNTTERTGYVTQGTLNTDGSETVYQINQNSDRSVAGAKAATVSHSDIRQILGEKSFSELQQNVHNDTNRTDKTVRFSDLSTEQKEKVMSNLAHDVARSEAENVMEAFKIGSAKVGVGNQVSGKKSNSSEAKNQSAQQLGAISNITSQTLNTALKENKDEVLSEAALSKIKDEIKDPNAISEIDKLKNKTAVNVLAAVQQVLNPVSGQKAPESSGNDISDVKKTILSREATVRTIAKPEYSKDKKTPTERVQVESNGKTIQFDLDSEWMKDKEKFKAYQGWSFAQIYLRHPEIAKEIIEEKEKEGNITSVSKEAANSFANELNTLSSAAIPTIDGLEYTLKQSGKLDKTYNTSTTNKLLEGASTVGKGLVNVMVQTAKDSVPYYQAYLKAKDRADNTAEELEAAKDKLEAANKKLKQLEQQINAFAVKAG